MSVDFEVGIVGAGFGGLIAALELRGSGHNSFVIFERSTEVGGVWRENIYPGCACDVRTHLYSIASQPNPQWSSSYATQPEILNYLKDVVLRNDLQNHIRFETAIQEIKFLDNEGIWQVTDNKGGRHRLKVIILATGPHSRPSLPSIPGLENFQGRVFHSSAWDVSIDLVGKKVAVIGTGASAIQIVPNIASKVTHLTVFQRTPAWIISRNDRDITFVERWLFQHLPWTQVFARGLIYWLMELVGLAFLGNDLISRVLTKIALAKLRREIRDPLVRSKLTPNYTIGCKRILVSDDFYPAFNRPNVELVTDNISEIKPTGILTRAGRLHEADYIVFATGFIVADPDNYLRVLGKGGRVLTAEWEKYGTQAYLGITVAGFPNMTLLLGPNSGLSHSSALHVMESQMKYIAMYLAECMKAGDKAFLDVKPEVQDLYNAQLQDRLTGTVWNSGCKSWYLDRNGVNTTIFPGLTNRYRRLTAAFDIEDYLVIDQQKY